jgi:DNA-binding MarR family transcriptional regulator
MCCREELEERLAIGALLKKITLQLRYLADSDMKEWDLTWSQSHVLHHLTRHHGEMSQKELEKELNISHPTMVGLIQRMENKDFVKTRTCDEDHRKKIVTLTAKAASHRQSMWQRMREKEQIMTKGLSEEEVESLICSLEKVYANLTEYREGQDIW